jgi:predicted DNA-binding transcriptional regulator YafY
MKANTTTAAITLTAQRAARLYKLLMLLADSSQARRTLLVRLKLDLRGFYRDLEALRTLGIDLQLGTNNRYSLPYDLNLVLEKLPFPDPGLNVRDVLQLVNGPTAAHRKLKQRVIAFLGSSANSRPHSAR